jgi:hypothetical protein
MLVHAQAALRRGYHIFPLAPKGKVTLAGSHGFKDSRAPSDPLVLAPWKQNPSYNIGIDLGASDLCVLDFDKPESVPPWLNQLRTHKVRTAKGLHIYFRGARKTSKLHVDGQLVGDVKSAGSYVLGAGCVHPSGAVYTVADDSPVAAMPPAVVALLRKSAAQASNDQPINASSSGPPIPYGQHNNELLRIAGKLRAISLDREDIEPWLVKICENRCIDYGADYREMCRDIAETVQHYPPYDQRRKGSPFAVRRKLNECTRCHEPQERRQLKGHPIVYVRGIKQQPLCPVCAEEIKAMNWAFCNVKPTKGRMLAHQRWYLWLAFISIPKGKFLRLTLDEQEAYMRSLCDKALRLNLDVLSFPREGERDQ